MKYPKIKYELDRRRVFTQEETTNIKELYATGSRIGTIAKMFGKSHSTIKYIIDPDFALKRKLEARAKNAKKRSNPVYVRRHRLLSNESHKRKRAIMPEERTFDRVELQNWKRKNPTQYEYLKVRQSTMKKLQRLSLQM